MRHTLIDLLRITTISLTSVAIGFSVAIAWNFRKRQTIPPYMKVMGFSYTAFAVFTLAATQDALRQDRPATWITWVGLAAALVALFSTLWAWRSSHQNDH
jgi:uncharacterized membrane protein YfcA